MLLTAPDTTWALVIKYPSSVSRTPVPMELVPAALVASTVTVDGPAFR